MKKVIENSTTLIIAVIGLIGGIAWLTTNKTQIEPIILSVVSFVEIVAYSILRFLNRTQNEENLMPVQQNQNLNLNLYVDQNSKKREEARQIDQRNRDAIIQSMKPKLGILFIDDDKNFNVVKILKDSGWKKTKTVTDIPNMDVPYVQEADIYFVDINGVGKQLGLEYGGLDLALMLKQKYPSKKIVIYSANKNSNSFHEAWNKCDYKLEKNALPYQFQNIVEELSMELSDH
jgi:hypothetical protein